MQNNKRILFITYVNLLKPLDLSNGIINGSYRNSGDTVYFTAGISYFYGLENIKIVPDNEIATQLINNPNWAKDNFDIAIKMHANFFHPYYKDELLQEKALIEKLQIPYYVLGVGAQSSIDYSFDFLDKIESNVKQYVDAILNSGGTLTLRGEFTNECLKKLGYRDLFVSGCPSLYLNGDNFAISNTKVAKQDFKPMFCGSTVESIDKKLYREYSNSAFFDQDIYLESLYEPEKFLKNSFLTPLFMELYKNNRIKGSMNYQPWKNQIIEGKYTFSYGSRIHGNIIALQNNIPAFVKVHDSRTREIAEFYEIPNCMNVKFDEKCDSLYDLYSELDYTNFNKTYQKRYSDFKNFLDKEQIPNLLGNNSSYLNYIASLNYCIQDTNFVKQKKIQFIRHAQWKMLQNKLLKKERKGNKRIIHILGIKISYKKRQNLAISSSN